MIKRSARWGVCKKRRRMKEKKKESVTKFALAIRENAFEALLVLVFGVFNTAFGGDCISICRGCVDQVNQ